MIITNKEKDIIKKKMEVFGSIAVKGEMKLLKKLKNHHTKKEVEKALKEKDADHYSEIIDVVEFIDRWDRGVLSPIEDGIAYGFNDKKMEREGIDQETLYSGKIFEKYDWIIWFNK